MTNLFKLFVCSIVLLSLPADYKINAQSGPSGDVSTMLDKFCRDVPWEEIYVHTDRDIYGAGEEMWFSSYLFDRHAGKLSSGSNIAYFELLNPDDIPVIQKRLLIKEGICPGNAHLPDTLTSGIYTYRIYTNWMKNFLPENAFMKSITIVNPFRSNGFRKKIMYEKHLPLEINIEFFPEGGTLLGDVPGKIAVRVSDEFQRGVAFQGVVRNSRGDSVTSFITNRYGLASFEINPSGANSYYVLHGGTVTYLPLAQDEGCALRADYLDKDLITITLSERGSLYSSDSQQYYLLIQSHGSTSYFESFRIPGFSKTIIISGQGLSKGINHITLFNQNLKPVCERLICIRQKDISEAIDLKISDSIQRREKVTAEIGITNDAGAALSEPRLSISVVPQLYGAASGALKDYLVFGTEFGYLPWVENGNQGGSPDEKDFDNFLIGAKSRWILWNEVFNENRAPKNFRMEEDVHFLSGVINKRDTPVSSREKTLTLSIPGKIASFYHTHTDSEGYFSFLLPVDQIQRNLIIQPESGEENISVEIQSPYSRNLPLSVSYKDSVTSGMSGILSDISARYQVNMIFGTSVKKEAQPVQLKSEPSKRFYGKPEIELIMNDYIKLPVMQEIFFELTPGVRLRERKAGYEMRILNPYTGTYFEEPATALIDGVVINDMATLAGLDPEVVERIDIVKTPYFTGDFMHYGIVHVITQPGKFSNLSLPDYAVKLPYRITEPVQLFLSPDYSDPVKKQSRIPDFRNTLYWNPALKPEKDGKISVEFDASDLAGDYVIDIQGINSYGEPVSLRKIIQIY